MKSLFEKLKSKHARGRQTVDLNWLNELDGMDDLSALEKSTQFLSNFSTDQAIPDNKRLETLFIVDRYNRQRIRKVFQQYIKFSNLRPELDARIFEVAYYYFRQLKLNYHLQTQALLQHTDRLKLHSHNFPLALGRTIYATFAMVRLRNLARQTCPNSAWIDIYQLYEIAEQEGLLDIPLKLYDDLDSISIDTLLVHACMQDSIHQCNMNRQQIELAGDLIRMLAPAASMVKEYNEKKHLYFIDLDEDKGPRRIRHLSQTPACRYWEISDVLIKIDLIVHSITAKKSLESFNLNGLASHPLLLDVLSTMKAEWSGYQRQRRKEDRKTINRLATVSWGIESVTNQIRATSKKKLTAAKTFEERLATHSLSSYSPNALTLYATGERWVISDESDKGFGAEINKEQSRSLRQDKIANVVMPDINSGNIIGIVRNVVEMPHNKMHVGIEVISRRATVVQALKIGSTKVDIANDAALMAENILGITCLFLPVEEGLSDKASIIMPRLNFIENSVYQISNRDSKLLVRLGRAQDMKDDWARVTVEVNSSPASL